MDNPWQKVWSKSHQREYWFNSNTNEKSWDEPEEIKKDSRKRRAENSTSLPVSSDASSSSVGAKRQASRPEVAIIVPYRDLHVEQKRKQHLDRFIDELPQFMNKSSKPYRIYIIEQSDDGRKFNRGKLLNIGYKIAAKEGNEVFIFHDVDLLPSEDLLPYYISNEGAQPIHIARVWNRYNGNSKYFGGIVNFSKSQFEQINGFPNNFWGWGGEDDEMFKRIQERGFKPMAPTTGAIIDMEEMDLNSKLSFLKSHRLWKCMNKSEVTQLIIEIMSMVLIKNFSCFFANLCR